ncbi:acetyltransferase [Podospora appendiculata]|uniref:Acetyltransferase n=1 Tax=Podospora appendiculata TaxID=314037 RepID=A0AAE0XKJ6_9PEZI|nr:acetyltransferase [Podospora appendiculata]
MSPSPQRQSPPQQPTETETETETEPKTETETKANQNPTPPAILTLPKSNCTIQPYTPQDAPTSQQLANNPNIAQNMRDTFPSPYTLADAETWIAIANANHPPRDFTIRMPDPDDGSTRFIGAIGLKPFTDVEARTMEIGYWLGEPYWGRSIMTEALIAFTRWAFENNPELLRLEAGVFEPNEGSARVLARAGYTYEGCRRNAVYKNGKVFGVKLFSFLREELS